MKTEDRATENLLKIALGEAAPTEHLDRRDAMAELLRRLYREEGGDIPQAVEERLDELEKVVDAIPPAVNQNKDRLAELFSRVSSIRDWCDRVDDGLDSLHNKMAERTVGAEQGPVPAEQVMDTITYHAERASELTEKALEASGDEREDYIAAARIHNQTARALSVVVDHKREAAS